MKSKRSKACDISPRVRARVLCRDGGECIICHKSWGLQVAHYIPRSQGGLGVEQNLVLLCPECHADFDNGNKRKDYGDYIRNYLKWQYADWNEKDLIYDKWRERVRETK